jgi:Inorganic Pyrophosphatase
MRHVELAKKVLRAPRPRIGKATPNAPAPLYDTMGEWRKIAAHLYHTHFSQGGYATGGLPLSSILRRGQPISPMTPDPTSEEMDAARADTRVGADIVSQRLNTIVPESSRVVGGSYTPGAPNGGRWADLPSRVLNASGIGFKFTPGQRQAEHDYEKSIADLSTSPDDPNLRARAEGANNRLRSEYARGDDILHHLWQSAVSESSQAAKNAVASHGVRPFFGAKDWDRAMRLPIRDHLWYELSGEKMAENMPDLTADEYMKMMDLVGATSARAEPGENLERSLGVLSQHLRGAPVDVDLTIPPTVQQALSRSSHASSALPGNKTGHFSDTLALTGGVPTRFPISVNDVWVGRMFGVPDEVMSQNQSLHEPMALYFNKIRDLYNNIHEKELPFKYQSWNFQAPSWVHLRNEEADANSGDAYHQVWGGIINKLKDAGIPGIEGDKIRREALMHPGFADALRRTTKGFREAPKATVEFGTTQTDVGKAAHDLYKAALTAGDTKSQKEYLTGLTTAMYHSARGKHPWDSLKKAVTGDIKSSSDITRITHPTTEGPLDVGGTFEGAVSPNIRIPLKDMSDDQIAMFNAIAGKHLKQDAMAVSSVIDADHGSSPRDGHVRGYSAFVPTTERIDPDHVRNFAKELSELGHDMSYTRYPNGYKFDILPAFGERGPEGIDEDRLSEAYAKTMMPHYGVPKIMAHDFKSVYNEASEYDGLRQKLIKGIRDDFLAEAVQAGIKLDKARKALSASSLPEDVRGRGKRAWDRYRTRLSHLSDAENGFKALAQRVADHHSNFLESAGRRRQTLGYSQGGDVESAGDIDIPHIDNPVSVFPKPQRMFPQDAWVAGGQYLDAKTGDDLTGHKSQAASIGINESGRPYFTASANPVDETGSPGRGSATAKTNLFKKKAGWQWVKAPKGHENTDTIVSVEHRGQHHYALNAHFPKGVDFARYAEEKSEPRLRPTTKGNVLFGNQVGSIAVRGREHPVYDHVIVKSYGGDVEREQRAMGGNVGKSVHTDNDLERKTKVAGLDIGIQTDKGQERKHHGGVKFPAPYGYIGKTEDNDDMNVDVYLGPNKNSKKAYVINQLKKNGKFDEHKVMLGYDDKAAAVKDYKASWPKKKAERKYGDTVEMTTDQLKHWLKKGNTKEPITKNAIIKRALMIVSRKA